MKDNKMAVKSAIKTKNKPSKYDWAHQTLAKLGIGSGIPFHMKRVVTPLELTSLNALIAYAADEADQTENSITEMVVRQFDVHDLQQLPSDKFEDAVRFLVDAIDAIKVAH